jgi:PAS domain S-box-containing protein
MNLPGGGAAVAEGAGLHRLLVDSVRDYAIFALDVEGHVLSWNAGAERLKGYAPEEIIGRHFSAFYPRADQEAGKPAWALAAAARDGSVEDEGWRIRKDGTRFWANVVITALRDEAGTLVRFAKVTRDLTERRAAQERLIADERRLAEAEAASRARSEFLAAMSHELRTPINATLGYAELMEMEVAGPLTERQRDYIARIRGTQQHLLGIVTDLLNYSRLEAGEVEYDLAPVPVGSILGNVLPMVEPQALSRRLSLVRAPCPDDLMVLADRAKAEQIVLNLLGNAVKFTPAGGTVTIGCEPAGTHVHIAVADTGEGIAPDQQAAIFEPFVQLGRSLTSGHEGTGLGLAISRDLARAMGGELTVSSTPGAGSVFTLALGSA